MYGGHDARATTPPPQSTYVPPVDSTDSTTGGVAGGVNRWRREA